MFSFAASAFARNIAASEGGKLSSESCIFVTSHSDLSSSHFDSREKLEGGCGTTRLVAADDQSAAIRL
jgi:hypothetical protein